MATARRTQNKARATFRSWVSRAKMNADRRYAALDPQWKSKGFLALLVVALGVGVVPDLGVWALVVALPIAAALLPFPFLKEWGTETLGLVHRFALGVPMGRIPGTPGGRKQLLRDLGFAKPAASGEPEEEPIIFWVPVRIGSWLSLAAASIVTGVAAPSMLANVPTGQGGLSGTVTGWALAVAEVLALVLVTFLFAQVAALVHRRGSYVRNELGMPAPDPWRVAVCWDTERAFPVLKDNTAAVFGAALVAAVAAFVVSPLLCLPAAVLAGGAVFIRRYTPVYAADRMAQRAEMESWNLNWTQMLGTKAVPPSWIAACELPLDSPGAVEPKPKTHRMLAFANAPGTAFKTYEVKLPEIRTLVGQEMVTIQPSPKIGADGRPISGTEDPNAFAVVYPLFTPEGPFAAKPYLDPELEDMSRQQYLTAILGRLFTASKVGSPRMVSIKRLGGTPAPVASSRARRDAPTTPTADGPVLEGTARRRATRPGGRPGGRPGAPGKPAKPAQVLLETAWEFPTDAMVTPAQMIALRDLLKDKLAVPYLALGQRRGPDGESLPQLVIVLGCVPTDAYVTKAADLRFLADLEWDTVFRANGLTGGGMKGGPTPALVKKDTSPAGLEVFTFRTAGGLPVENIEQATQGLLATTHKAYVEVMRDEKAGHFRIAVADFHPLDRPFKLKDHARKVLTAPGALPNLEWVAGVGPDDGYVTDSFDEELPHLFIGGATKMGKSTLLNSAILQLAYHNTPEQLEFWMAEPKNELQTWQVLPHVKRFIDRKTPTESAYEALGNMLGDAVVEMERRYAWLDDLRIPGDELSSPKNLGVAYEHGLVPDSAPVPFIIIFIEECGDYFKPPTLKDHKPFHEAMLSDLEKLTRKARAAGIFIVALTQYPIKENIPSTAKQQMRRIGLGTADSMASLVILGVTGLEELSTRGRGIALSGKERHGFRSFYYDGDGELTEMLKKIPSGLIHRRRVFDERGIEVTDDAPKAAKALPALPSHITWADDDA